MSRGKSSYAKEYERQVCERMDLLRSDRPDETNWIGYACAEHEPGECVECDALRRLEAETDASL